MAKIQIPDNYEEALARKEEVLKLINAYSEALLNDTELPCSEEEIELLQEEYSLLDEYVELTDVEKEAYSINENVEYVEVVEEDGTVTKKVKLSFWDKVNPFIFVYAVIIIIGSLWFSVQGIGIELINLFSVLVEKFKWDLSQLTMDNLLVIFCCIVAVYPILFVLFSFINARFICRKKETKLIGYILLAFHFVLILINYIVVVVQLIKVFE